MHFDCVLFLLLACTISSSTLLALNPPFPSGSFSSDGKFSRVSYTSSFPSTPLDEYVNAPDPFFAWSDTGITFSGAGWTGHVLNMSSQKW